MAAKVQAFGRRKRERGFLQNGEFFALVEGVPEYLKDFVSFLYYGGWRKGAARNLQWKDIDLETRTARLAIKRARTKNLGCCRCPESNAQLAIKSSGTRRTACIGRYRIVDEDELRQAQERQQA